MREPEYLEIVLVAPDDLDPDRKSLRRETARDRDRGQTRHRHPVARAHPVEVILEPGPIDLAHPGLVQLEGRDLAHGQHQEFVALHELADPVVTRGAQHFRAREIIPAESESLLDVPDDRVLDALALALEQPSEAERKEPGVPNASSAP